MRRILIYNLISYIYIYGFMDFHIEKSWWVQMILYDLCNILQKTNKNEPGTWLYYVYYLALKPTHIVDFKDLKLADENTYTLENKKFEEISTRAVDW